MTWEEFKKKKKEEEANKENTKTTNNSTSQMSSWQKYKQERELKNSQNKIENKNNNEESQNTILEYIGNFMDGTGKIVDNMWQGMKNGVMSLQQTVGRTANDAQADSADLNQQMFERVMSARAEENPEEKEQINEAINNYSISGDKIREESKEYYDKIQSKKNKNIQKMQENSDSIQNPIGKYLAEEIAPSMGQMLPGMIGGPIGTTYFIGSATGNYYDDAKQRGMTEEQATMYSGLMGMIEGSLESLGAKLTTNVGKKLLKNNIKGAFIDYGLDIGENFLEEAIVEPISEGMASITGGKDKSDWNGIVQRMIESGIAGAITSVITGGTSALIGKTIGVTRNNKTTNEQKVYDNEVNERVNEKVRQTTIEQAYNEQIKAQENLGIEITDDLKNQIMQKVENAYDNGTLKSIELNRKDKLKIEDQVEKDMQDGNISAENIMKTLGENQDISKDNLLMRSMYENEQKYNSYQVEQTDNEKVNILLQSAADAGMNNTRKTRRKVELISKLVQDTDRQYKFVSPENLKEMGYNENANGLIDKSTGEILINAHSEKGIQSIVGHETTHIFDNKDSKGTYTKEYQTLQDMTIEYAKTKGIYDSKVKSITDAYGNLLVDENQIKEELTADLVGDFLFNDEKFIENLSIKDKNVFQKIYDYIKHIYKVATAGTEEAKAIENLKYQFDKVYKNISKEKNNNDIKYSIGGKEALKNIENPKLRKKAYDSYEKAKKMARNKESNKKIFEETGWYKDNITGKMKFNFSDKDMQIVKRNYKVGQEFNLEDMLVHETLFEMYPELKKYKVKIEDMNKNYSKNNSKINGRYNRMTDELTIDINRFANISDADGTLIHEIQHAIQKIEGFASGTSTKFGKERYRKNPGEIEARDTTKRMIQEKYNNKDLSEIIPKSSNVNATILEKMKIGLYNYLSNISKEEEYDENIKINQKEISSDASKNNGLVLGGINIENENSNESSFSFDNKAKRYEDLVLADKINYNKYNNGKINVEIFNNNELINQFSVNSKEEAVKQLGANIGDYIYENVNEDIKVLNLSNKTLKANTLQNNKEKQFDIIKKTNPMLDDYHVGIRKVEDIKTFEEIINDDESFVWGDFSKEDAEKALKRGKITIYSSYPIKQGTFVSTSKIQAEQYAGGIGQKIYQKTVSLDEVAWINGDEGQYANINQKYSLTNDTNITDDDIAVKDMLAQQRPTIENEVGIAQKKTLETNISSEGELESNTDKYNRYKKNIIKARETEVNNLIKNKNEAITEIEHQIVEKEKELNNKKDKNTKVANNLKIQIENLKQRKSKIENEYNSRIDRKNDKVTKNKIDLETKKQLSLTRKEVKEQLLQKMNITEANISVGEDISSPNFQITDPVRVNEKVFGKEIGTKINEVTINKTKHHTAEKIRWQNNERKEIADLKIKARSKESAAVQKYGEKQYVDEDGKTHNYGDAELANDFKDIVTQEKIKNAARVIRNKYDNFIDLTNNVLTGLGYSPIPKRKDYMRHFQELSDKFSQTGVPLNLNDLKENDLPTDINGLTEFNKPGKNWFASAMPRTGEKTTYDAITGIDGYIEGIGNLIFHTEDIQNYRALSSLIRDTYGQQNGLDNIDNMTEDEVSKRIKDIQDNKLSKYVAWIDEQANSLAGKKGAIDRGFERFLGRKVYTVFNTAKKQVGSNMTGFNGRGSLTNLVSSVMAASKTKKAAFVKGTISTINNIFKQDDFIDKSDFLTSRFGSDLLSQKFWQKASNMGQVFMSGTDWFTSNQIVRSKYYEGLSKKMTESEAIKYADDFASRVMGDRSQGATAELFNSKTLGLFTQFQLEVNNQWQFMIHDTKMDYQQNKEDNSGLKAGATAVFQMGQLAAYSYFFNELFEKLTGSRATFDPIEIIKTLFGIDDEDDEKTFDERLSEAGKLLVDNIPFANLFTDGGRIPVSEAFTGVSALVKKVAGGTDEYGNVLTWEDVGKEFKESLPYWVMPTGYSQAKKTIKGLSLYLNDIPGSYTDSGDLRYTVEDDVGSKVQAAIFGAYANPYAQDYIDSGFKTISKDNIDEMVGLGMNSSEYRELKEDLNNVSTTTDKNGYKQYVDSNNKVYWYDSDSEIMYDSNYNKTTLTEDDLQKVSKTEETLNYINSLDLTNSQKNIIANNLNKNSKKTIDMKQYSNYSSYEEYKYARDYPEKYNVISQITDYNSFEKYKEDIDDIKKQYSSELGYESKDRKNAVQEYINGLDLNIYQKMMLEKMAGGYSIKNYRNYIYEYLESTDLTNSEKYSIWEELFN